MNGFNREHSGKGSSFIDFSMHQKFQQDLFFYAQIKYQLWPYLFKNPIEIPGNFQGKIKINYIRSYTDRSDIAISQNLFDESQLQQININSPINCVQLTTSVCHNKCCCALTHVNQLRKCESFFESSLLAVDLQKKREHESVQLITIFLVGSLTSKQLGSIRQGR